MNPAYELHIVDGSDNVWRPSTHTSLKWYTFHSNVRGGADASLAFCLSMMLNHEANYTHVGIVEMDVLLDEGWFEETMKLFERGKQDGLVVGAVSPRSYCDRILLQRDDHAICHNLGAGSVIFSREAAELVLRSFRTGFWPDNVRLFAQLSGIDLRTYAAFRGNEQPITSDWLWDAILARHGLASLALTPARCQMIGQAPPLEQQGLELTTADNLRPQNDFAFETYQANLAFIRQGKLKFESPGIIRRDGSAMLFFPHQLGYLAGAQPWQGTLELAWVQGHGPFAYRAGPGGASLSVRISGFASFLATGGSAGARIAITDTRSGFNFAPDLPADQGQGPISITVPGGPVPRIITMNMAEGAVFYGLSCDEPQMLDTTFKFDWSQLPEAK
jgi:hypothetical protein